MTVLLDLVDYADEVEAFAGIADEFVDAGSALKLKDVARELRNFVDTGTSSFVWQTPGEIAFRSSRLYDGPGREHTQTDLRIGFTCEFRRPVKTRKKCRVWQAVQAATHVTLEKDGGQLRFHVDYKNVGQWGPQIHFQIVESDETGNLCIPRMPALSFLPTDCADLALAELHPEEWRKVQASGAKSRHVSIVRSAQQARVLAYLGDIGRQWEQDRLTTRVSMLQDYTAALSGLPDRHGNEPRLA